MAYSINIKLFATLKEKAQANNLVIELRQEQVTAGELLELIGVQKPSLRPVLKSVLFAVNQEFAFPGDIIHPGDEVAMFPPVSGG